MSWEDHENRPETSRDRWARLARTFPTLENAPGVQSHAINPVTLDMWAAKLDEYDGVREAAQFVLHVFHCTRPWAAGPFNLSRAIGSWDAEHREAFARWAQNPETF